MRQSATTSLAGLSPSRTASSTDPLDFSPIRSSVGPTDDQTEALRKAGVARTAIDRRLVSDRVTGSLGFLCGLHAAVGDDIGAAAMRGSDPQGKFLGAKLSFAFK